jgi:hypothetical protein
MRAPSFYRAFVEKRIEIVPHVGGLKLDLLEQLRAGLETKRDFFRAHDAADEFLAAFDQKRPVVGLLLVAVPE